MNMRATLNWTKLKDGMPKMGSSVIGAQLSRFSNAPWRWSFFEVYYNGNWGDYSTPDLWAYIPEPPIPTDDPEYKKALKVHAEENEYRRRRKQLDEEFGHG